MCKKSGGATRVRRARTLLLILALSTTALACGGTSGADATMDADDVAVGVDIASDIASDSASDEHSTDAAPPPSDGGTPVPPVPGEWTQHAHDPQRSGYTPQMVPPPWRFRWQWFDREVANGEPGLPRNVQPVTGGGRVYIARGARGVIALRASDGSVAWENRALEGSASATPAFHPATGTLLLTTTAGRLYQLDASTGGVVRSFSFEAPDPRIAYVGGAAPSIVSSLQRAGISFAPLLVGDTVFVSARRSVIALSTGDLRPQWTYDAASEVHTPAAYSESARVIVVATSDLHVHAIEAASGTRRWRVRPYDVARPDPEVQYLFGWPVIAEQHGVVLMKIRLSWALALTQWPTTITAMRGLVTSRPELQSLHALSLTDGSQPFRPLVGHGGYGDGDYMPMGPQPVVRRDGATEVVYTVIRGDDTYDFRWDSRFGEMVLDDRTVTGLRAGDVRWIYFDPAGQNAMWPRPFLLTDEQPYVSMAGDVLFGAHWAAGHALRIGDRGPSRGSFAAPITSTSLPAVVESTMSCPASRSQYCAMGASLDGDGRVYGPSAFYLRHSAGAFYDRHWSEYATWIVSNDAVYFRSCSGTLLALESGDPTSVRGASDEGREDEASASTPSTREASTPVLSATSAHSGDERVSLVVSPREARAYVGRHVTLDGVVSYVIDNGKALYFAFQRPHQGMPVVIVPRAAWTRFAGGPRSIARRGERLRVRGALRWYQGDPAMDLLDPTQLDRPSSSERSALR
jgi:hypothetical protein